MNCSSLPQKSLLNSSGFPGRFFGLAKPHCLVRVVRVVRVGDLGLEIFIRAIRVVRVIGYIY